MKKKQNESKMKQENAYADVNVEEIEDMKKRKQCHSQIPGKHKHHAASFIVNSKNHMQNNDRL